MHSTRTRITLSLLALSLSTLCGCATTIKTKTLTPARAHEAAQLTRVAVLPFGGKVGRQTQSDVEAVMVSAQVDGKPFFNVIERTEIEKIAKEQRFQLSGSIDESSIASLGKMLGAQAIVYGTVNQNDTEDKHYNEQRSRCSSKDNKGNCKSWSNYTVGCTSRAAVFQFTPKIVKVETGSIVASEVISGEASDSACSDSGSPLQGGNELLEAARKGAMAQYRTFVAPYYVDVEIALVDSDDSKMAGPVKDKIADGVKWAKSGRLDRACECWDQASRLHGEGYAIPYLMGVCCEVQGNLDGAQAKYAVADKQASEPVDEISAALTRVNAKVEAQRKLKEQMGK